MDLQTVQPVKVWKSKPFPQPRARLQSLSYSLSMSAVREGLRSLSGRIEAPYTKTRFVGGGFQRTRSRSLWRLFGSGVWNFVQQALVSRFKPYGL